jgi:metal-responsive CopG/Arc/MetJ family transcriptional regulator
MRSRKINLKLSADLLKAIDSVAKRNFENRSTFIRKSIALRLNEQHIVAHKPQKLDWQALLKEDEDAGV